MEIFLFFMDIAKKLDFLCILSEIHLTLLCKYAIIYIDKVNFYEKGLNLAEKRVTYL